MLTLKIKTSQFAKRWKIVPSLSIIIDYIAIDEFIEKTNGFFAILDGHGGS